MITEASYRALPPRRDGRYTPVTVDYRYLAIEGPVGLGKTALAERLAVRVDATAILEDGENPFLADFYQDRPGAAFQAQLFYLLSRHRQLAGLRQTDLFSQVTICDYLFDRDRIYAYLSLDDNELYIYQRLYDLLVREIPQPDLVVYLQAPTEFLLKRLRERGRDPDHHPQRLDPAYVKELNEAYQHFFFHYTTTPLLVVEMSQVDFERQPPPAARRDADRTLPSEVSWNGHGVVQTSEGAHCDGGHRRDGGARPRGAVGEMPVVRAGHL
jgi:deoxyguanosine kinase